MERKLAMASFLPATIDMIAQAVLSVASQSGFRLNDSLFQGSSYHHRFESRSQWILSLYCLIFTQTKPKNPILSFEQESLLPTGFPHTARVIGNHNLWGEGITTISCMPMELYFLREAHIFVAYIEF